MLSALLASSSGSTQNSGGAAIAQLGIFALIGLAMYFLLIRPQQKRTKDHREMLKSLRRGDVVVMSGGLIGKIAKVVDDNELLLDVGDGTAQVQVRVAPAMVQQLRAKGEPVKDAS